MEIKEFIASATLKLSQGKIRFGNGRAADLDKVYQEYITDLPENETPLTRENFKQQIRGHLEEEKKRVQSEFEENNPFETVFSSDDIVEQAIKMGNFHICPKGEKITQQGFNATLEDLETQVTHHNNHYKQASKGPDGKPIRPTFTTEEVRTALKFFLRTREIKTREELRDLLKFDPNRAQWTDQVITYLLETFNAKGDPALNLAVIKQWLWQTKRYIYGQVVPSPLMVNLLGKIQETGKTLLVRRLSQPMKDFYTEATLAQIIDPREAENWSSNYVVLFDELNLGHMDPSEFGRAMATFKFLLTTETISHRVMRTTKHSKSSRTFSPISTSNETMVNVVYDPTGMRRFFEIELDCKPDPERIQYILNLDFPSLWAGIDENMDKGFIYPGSDLFKQMSQVQDSYKRMEAIDWALQYLNYGKVPVHSDDKDLAPKVAQVKKADKLKDVKDLFAGTDLECCTLMEVRKRVADWIKEELGQDQVKYLAVGARFLNALVLRGYIVWDMQGNNPQIICRPVTQDMSSEVGI